MMKYLLVVISLTLLSIPQTSMAAQNSATLNAFKAKMRQGSGHSVNIYYRLLPRLSDQKIEQHVSQLFRTAKNSQARRLLVLGIADAQNPNQKYNEFLIQQFKSAKPEVKEAATYALGIRNAQEALPHFERYLRQRSNWTATLKLTEAVILALARLQTEKALSLYVPLLNDMPHRHAMAIRLTENIAQDRLASALAWSLIALGKSQEFESFFTGLYQSRAPFSSVSAAKALILYPDFEYKAAKQSFVTLEKPKTFLTNLVHNQNANLEVRQRAAQMLFELEGESFLIDTKFHGPTSKQIELELLRQYYPKKLDHDYLIKLLESEDDLLIAEAIMSFKADEENYKKCATHVHKIVSRLQMKKPSDFLQVMFNYANE